MNVYTLCYFCIYVNDIWTASLSLYTLEYFLPFLAKFDQSKILITASNYNNHESIALNFKCTATMCITFA